MTYLSGFSKIHLGRIAILLMPLLIVAGKPPMASAALDAAATPSTTTALFVDRHAEENPTVAKWMEMFEVAVLEKQSSLKGFDYELVHTFFGDVALYIQQLQARAANPQTSGRAEFEALFSLQRSASRVERSLASRLQVLSVLNFDTTELIFNAKTMYEVPLLWLKDRDKRLAQELTDTIAALPYIERPQWMTSLKGWRNHIAGLGGATFIGGASIDTVVNLFPLHNLVGYVLNSKVGAAIGALSVIGTLGRTEWIRLRTNKIRSACQVFDDTEIN